MSIIQRRNPPKIHANACLYIKWRKSMKNERICCIYNCFKTFLWDVLPRLISQSFPVSSLRNSSSASLAFPSTAFALSLIFTVPSGRVSMYSSFFESGESLTLSVCTSGGIILFSKNFHICSISKPQKLQLALRGMNAKKGKILKILTWQFFYMQ